MRSFFFSKAAIGMNASQLTERRAQASNTYRSNWQPRDASEVTLRHRDMSNKNNNPVHQGPVIPCCSTPVPPPRPSSPNNGFSTDYDANTVFNKKAGCADCNDVNWGAPGGVQLITCSEVATILAPEPNPVKGNKCYCADPGIKQKPGIIDCSYGVIPPYTGVYNQVPTGNGNGILRKSQIPPYPSG